MVNVYFPWGDFESVAIQVLAEESLVIARLTIFCAEQLLLIVQYEADTAAEAPKLLAVKLPYVVEVFATVSNN